MIQLASDPHRHIEWLLYFAVFMQAQAAPHKSHSLRVTNLNNTSLHIPLEALQILLI